MVISLRFFAVLIAKTLQIFCVFFCVCRLCVYSFFFSFFCILTKVLQTKSSVILFRFNKKTSENEHLYLVHGTKQYHWNVHFLCRCSFVSSLFEMNQTLFQFTFLTRSHNKNKKKINTQIVKRYQNCRFKWKEPYLEVSSMFFFLLSMLYKSLLLFL